MTHPKKGIPLDLTDYDQNADETLRLSDLHSKPIWVAWKIEDGKKIPKSPATGVTVDVTRDNGRFGTYAQAKKLNGGKVGVVLGPRGDYVLCGIDIDGCLNDAGDMLIVNELIERYNSYAEVSVSGTGLHVLFWMSSASVKSLGVNQRQFTKGEHRGIVLDLDKRYYVVSDKPYGARRDLRQVPLSDVQWLIEVIGPRYKGASATTYTRDESGSGHGYRFFKRWYRKHGDDYEEAVRAIKAQKDNAGDWAKRVDERQLQRAWEAAVHPSNGSGRDISWDIVHSGDFIQSYRPPDYLYDGILQRRFLYSLTAQTNGGKTAILLLLAAMVGLNHGSLADRELQGGRVLYLAGENPDDIRMRWMTMAHHLRFDPHKIDVHFLAARPSLKESMEAIAKEVETLGGVALVIVDTAAAFFEGNDENSNTEAGEYARRLRRLTDLHGGPCVIVACHPGKYATDDQLLPRGGGAFLFEMDGNLTSVNDGTFVKLHWLGKWRGPEFLDPIMFALNRGVTAPKLTDSKGRPISSVIAKDLSRSDYQERQAEAHSEEDQVLVALIDAAMSPTEIARKCGWSYKGEPYRQKAQRVLVKLEKQKLVKRRRGEYELTPMGEKVAKKLTEFSP